MLSGPLLLLRLYEVVELESVSYLVAMLGTAAVAVLC